MSTEGKYVPPSRRPGYVASASSRLPPSMTPSSYNWRHDPNLRTYSMTEIEKIFNHPRDSTLTFFSYPLAIREPYLKPGYDPCRPAEETPLPLSPPPYVPHPLGHLLRCFTLFPHAHPAWESHGELWTRTNANKLIEDWENEILRNNFNRPIPVFQEYKARRGEYTFEGWWQIDELRVVEAHSDELVRMMQFKEDSRAFSRSGRTVDAWMENLSTSWIKIKLSRAQGEYKEPFALLSGQSEGEGERYMLKIGGLNNELEVLAKHAQVEQE